MAAMRSGARAFMVFVRLTFETGFVAVTWLNSGAEAVYSGAFRGTFGRVERGSDALLLEGMGFLT